MATEAEVINKVRRRVADYREPRSYEDDYYEDALEFGINKLNFDFDENYVVVTDVPSYRVFLLVKLASIEMCKIRAAEGAEGESDEATDTKYTSIAVPDLSVSDGNAADSRGPAFWMKLAAEIQDEYDGEVGEKAGQNVGGVIEVGFVRKISLTHGGYRKRVLDPGLDAVTMGTPVVDGNDVLVSWSKLQTEGFSYYELTRDIATDFENEEILVQETDIHITEFLDEGLSAGTYYYRVKSVNPNQLKTESSYVSATVV